MPRKTDPRWGDKGQHVEMEVILKQADIDKLVDVLGLTSNETPRQELGSELSEYISDFFRTYEGDHLSFSRAEARKALVELQRSEEFTVQDLDNLNGRAEAVLYDAYVSLFPTSAIDSNELRPTWIGYILHHEKMETAITSAIGALEATSGPDPDTEIQLLTDRLMLVYEKFTGKRATHSNKAELMEYDQAPHSQAGRFATACYDIVNAKRPIGKAEVMPSQISNSLRRHVAARPKTER